MSDGLRDAVETLVRGWEQHGQHEVLREIAAPALRAALLANPPHDAGEGLDLTALAMLLHDHRPEPHLPPLLVAACRCGWGSEVFSHSAHQANEIGKWLRAALTAISGDADGRARAGGEVAG